MVNPFGVIELVVSASGEKKNNQRGRKALLQKGLQPTTEKGRVQVLSRKKFTQNGEFQPRGGNKKHKS